MCNCRAYCLRLQKIWFFPLVWDYDGCVRLFSRPCLTALWSPWLFLLSTDFLAQFWHDKMSCSHSTHTWLKVKHHPPIRDHWFIKIPMYHISICVVCSIVYINIHIICRIESLPALDHLRLSRELFFVTSPCNINKQRSEFQINFKCASLTFGHLETERRKWNVKQ